MESLVSIIIPVFNRAHLISETLDSIIAQTYKNWECIVVDDGSTDGTEGLINNYVKKDVRFKYHKRLANRLKGANACRNYGFELSKGDYIQWFDSDDLMHVDKLKIKVKLLKESDTSFVVCQGVEFMNTIDNVICNWDTIYSTSVLKDHIIGNVNFHTNGPMFNRYFLKDKMLFNENLQRKQEWEFYSRLLTYSIKYKPIYQPLYYFRVHENSINGINSIKTLASRIKANQLVFKLVNSNFNKTETKSLNKHFLNKYLVYFRASMKSKKPILILFSINAIFSHITFKTFFISIFKLIKQPKILYNIFK